MKLVKKLIGVLTEDLILLQKLQRNFFNQLLPNTYNSYDLVL